MSKVDCTQCSGKGIRPEWLHVSGGRCFYCNGTGKVEQSKTQLMVSHLLTKDKSYAEFYEMENGLMWIEIGIYDGAYDYDITTIMADKTRAREKYRELMTQGWAKKQPK